MAGVGPGLHNVRGQRLWSREICPGLSSIWCSSPACVGSGSTTYGTYVRRCFWRRMRVDVLGHSQLSITMDLYSHVMPSALRDAADAMDRALNGGR
jgi:hypothetical protein